MTETSFSLPRPAALVTAIALAWAFGALLLLGDVVLFQTFGLAGAVDIYPDFRPVIFAVAASGLGLVVFATLAARSVHVAPLGVTGIAGALALVATGLLNGIAILFLIPAVLACLAIGGLVAAPSVAQWRRDAGQTPTYLRSPEGRAASGR